MGYDLHFLERLDRVEAEELELALSLYKDTPLLKYILQEAELPEDAERVALALGSGEEPPYLIVSRTGGFVTCLGRGMRPGSWPVVSWRRLSQLIGRVEHLRERVEQSTECVQEHHGGSFIALFDRLLRGGYTLAQEDFKALLNLRELQPTMMPEVATSSTALLFKLDGRLKERTFRRTLVKGGAEADRFYRQHSDALWASVHAQLISAHLHDRELELLDVVFPVEPGRSTAQEVLLRFLTLTGVDYLDVRVALMSLWACARHGKRILPLLKRSWREATARETHVFAGLALCAVVCRHPKLRAEVKKVLQRLPEGLYAPKYGAAFQAMTLDFIDLYGEEGVVARSTAFAEQVGLTCLEVVYGEEGRAGLLQQLGVEAFPPALLASLSAHLQGPLLLETVVLTRLFQLLPAQMSWEAERFFLPRALLSVRPLISSSELSSLLLDTFARRRYGIPETRDRTVKRLGKNDPCPCGSGKKYGRCCRR